MRVLITLCLLASCAMTWSMDYTVERQLLRFDAQDKAGLSQARASENWQAVDDFGVHGYDDGIYWLKLVITPQLSEPQEVVVRPLYALHDKIDLYLFSNGDFVRHWAMGDTLINPGWVFADKSFAIPVNMPAGGQHEVFIRIEGINTKMLKTEVITYAEMQSSIHWNRLIFGAIYGMMMIMALYNLMIGIIVRDAAYVVYALQVTLFCLFVMTINGDGRYYLWRNYADFNHYAIQTFGVLYVFFIILFPWFLLKIKKYAPDAKRLFYFLMAIEFLFAIAVITQPYDVSMRIAVAVSTLFSPILFLSGLYFIYRKIPVAGIYTFAWSFYLFGATLVGLAAANIVEMNIFTLNGAAVGGLIEQLLLSIALAKRIHIERQERYEALKQAAASDTEATLQRKHFEDIFDRAPVGIVTLNTKEELTNINPNGCKLMGFENIQQGIDIGSHFGDRFSTKQLIRDTVLDKGYIIDHETVITTSSGEKKDCTITLIQEKENGEFIYEGYITDISERKKAQNIMLAMEEERMNSLEQLVTGVAHEINTPLGINLTAISFAKDELEKVKKDFTEGALTKSSMESYMDQTHGSLSLMETNLQKISVLVSRFKEVSFKHVAPTKQDIKLKEHVQGIFTDLLDKQDHVQFDLEIEAQDHIKIFPDLFEIILGQLIENSLVHGFKNQTEGNINLKITHDTDSIIIEYRDNGVGVEDDLKEQVFNPFVTSNRGDDDHSGLGLYRIYNLVTQVLKGQIELLNEKGFSIRIEFDL